MTVRFLVLLVLVACSASVRAADIVITKGGAAKSSLDTAGLMLQSDGEAQTFKRTLENDLVRSGWFTISGPGQGMLALFGAQDAGGGRFAVRCGVRNTANGKQFMDEKYRDDGDGVRRLAHRVADDIVFAVRGVKGFAGTRITMVGVKGASKDIYVCDADGDGLMRITKDGVVCIAPHWSQDGKSVVYTSFKSGYPDVYLSDLSAMKRRRISGFAGLNSGASMSPDGRWIALTLSKDGNPELYKLAIADGKPVRLTRTRYASEASPSWSPDGSRIVFVSDQGGSPQLYTIPASGGAPQRLTFKGGQNVSPDWGPDGRIACSRLWGGHYQIVVIEPGTGLELPLVSDGADYEDPSWARDGRHIVCSRAVNYRPELYILDTLGDPPIRFGALEGEWRSPDWSSE